jgi:hypothetical protein
VGDQESGIELEKGSDGNEKYEDVINDISSGSCCEAISQNESGVTTFLCKSRSRSWMSRVTRSLRARKGKGPRAKARGKGRGETAKGRGKGESAE